MAELRRWQLQLAEDATDTQCNLAEARQKSDLRPEDYAAAGRAQVKNANGVNCFKKEKIKAQHRL
jgi:hypothetical protein